MRIISLPREERGIADPIPEAVNWDGSAKVAVLGFKEGLDE